MAIFETKSDSICRVEETTFGSVGIQERTDLQRLLRENIEVIAPDTLVLGEEFGEWTDSRRRIDLLGLDHDANLVVIELKRTEDGGHMELQAIRYAAMVSTMTFDRAVEVLSRHLTALGKADSARAMILSFLEWEQPDHDRFAQEVRIVLASAEFSRELTTAVLWLNEHDLDIRCVRMKPYILEERLLVDVQQIVPLPEAADYQVQVKEKAKKERESRGDGVDFTRFDVSIRGTVATALWKRNAIWLVCMELCKGGIAPERIAEIIHWRPTRVWYAVEAVVDAAGFVVLAVKASPKFDTRRWSCGDGELVQYEGKTYALSNQSSPNQWGGDNWHKAMKLLQAAFPDFEIRYNATG